MRGVVGGDVIDTRKVTDRRELRFKSLKDILEELEYLDSGDPPRAGGNWTAAQNVRHVADLIRFSIEGFPVKRAPLRFRLAARFARDRILREGFPAGVRLPRRFASLAPRPDVGWDEAAEALRAAIGRAEAERMKQRSPVFGRLTHEQWEQFHCRHAELHFSFLHPE